MGDRLQKEQTGLQRPMTLWEGNCYVHVEWTHAAITSGFIFSQAVDLCAPLFGLMVLSLFRRRRANHSFHH